MYKYVKHIIVTVCHILSSAFLRPNLLPTSPYRNMWKQTDVITFPLNRGKTMRYATYSSFFFFLVVEKLVLYINVKLCHMPAHCLWGRDREREREGGERWKHWDSGVEILWTMWCIHISIISNYRYIYIFYGSVITNSLIVGSLRSSFMSFCHFHICLFVCISCMRLNVAAKC